MAGRQLICTHQSKSNTLALCVKLSGNRQAWRLVFTHTTCCIEKKINWLRGSIHHFQLCTLLPWFNVSPHSLRSTQNGFITLTSRNTLIPIPVLIYLLLYVTWAWVYDSMLMNKWQETTAIWMWWKLKLKCSMHNIERRKRSIFRQFRYLIKH